MVGSRRRRKGGVGEGRRGRTRGRRWIRTREGPEFDSTEPEIDERVGGWKEDLLEFLGGGVASLKDRRWGRRRGTKREGGRKEEPR